jgi:hypothetical protein
MGLPYLPLYNAGMLFYSRDKFINFQQGEGIRYLTMFAQDIAPINNEGIFYTFQGITKDGKYYISAILPVESADLPAKSEMSNEDYKKFSENYTQYLSDIEEKLIAQSPDSFTPDLNKLDGLIATISIQ